MTAPPKTPDTSGAVKLADLEKRNDAGEVVGLVESGRWFKKGAPEPFTGKLAHFYNGGQVETLKHFKNGLLHGPETSWYGNGKKRLEIIYDQGQETQRTAWDADGLKQP
jgi:antitoxin component YwqK of YwqJK toxin-antitoxin module